MTREAETRALLDRYVRGELTHRQVTDVLKARAPADFGPEELAKREDAARFAVANTRIEGGEVSPETQAVLELWVASKISDDELDLFVKSWTARLTRP